MEPKAPSTRLGRRGALTALGLLAALGCTAPEPSAPALQRRAQAVETVLALPADVAGNDEGGALVSPAGVARAGRTVGLAGFTAAGALPTPLRDFALAASPQALYVAGGFDGANPTAQVLKGTLAAGGLTFTASSEPLPAARRGAAAVAYGGRLYVAGGELSGQPTDEVWVAPLSALGNPGKFTATASLPLPRRYLALVALEGRLMALGGEGPGGPGTEVWIGELAADGGVLAWKTSVPLPSPRRQHAAVAHLGRVLVVGGEPAGASSQVLWGALAPDGTFGGWLPTTALPGPRAAHAAFTAGGTLYVVGGRGSAGVSLMAPLLPSGGVGAWSATAPLGAELSELGAAALGSEAVAFGGAAGGTAKAEAWRSALNPSGMLTSLWRNERALPSPRDDHRLLAGSGMLVSLGGHTDTGISDELLGALVLPDGSLGPWNLLGRMPQGRSYLGAALANRRLFVVGGCDVFPCLAAKDTVWTFSWDGVALSGAVVGTPYPEPTFRLGCALHGNRLYCGGGLNAQAMTFKKEVYSAPVDVTTGAVGPWTPEAAFPTTRDEGNLTAHGGHLYQVGGGEAGTPDGKVYFAALDAQGKLTSWKETTPLPQALSNVGVTAFAGRLYVVGGLAPAMTTLYSAPLLDDGSVGAWVRDVPLTQARSGPGVAVERGRMYLVGGWTGGAHLDLVQSAALGLDGQLSAFGAAGTLPGPLQGHASFLFERTLFIHGGGVYSAAGYAAPLSSSGAAGAFSPVPPLPEPRYLHSVTLRGREAYAVAGESTGRTLLTSVARCELTADGGTTAWAQVADVTPARRAHASFLHKDRLYVLGGLVPPSDISADVKVAALAADGGVGPFVAAAPLPAPRTGHAVATTASHVYVLGGDETASSSGQEVLYAALQDDGALGPWRRTSTLLTGRYRPWAVARDGWVYALGGLSRGSYVDSVEAAPVLPGGELGPFTEATPLPFGRNEHTAELSEGLLYSVGGSSAAGTQVLAAALQTPAARALYSRRVELGVVPVDVLGLTLTASAASASRPTVRGWYRAPDAAGGWGAWTALGPLALGQEAPLGLLGVRALWLRLELDESASATLLAARPAYALFLRLTTSSQTLGARLAVAGKARVGESLPVALQLEDGAGAAVAQALPLEVSVGAPCTATPAQLTTAANGSAQLTLTCSAPTTAKLCAAPPVPGASWRESCAQVEVSAKEGTVTVSVDRAPFARPLRIGESLAVLATVTNGNGFPLPEARLAPLATGAQLEGLEPDGTLAASLGALEKRGVALTLRVVGPPGDGTLTVRVVDAAGQALSAEDAVPFTVEPLRVSTGCSCGAAGASGLWLALLAAAWAYSRTARSSRWTASSRYR